MFYSRNYVHRNNLIGTGIAAFILGAAAWAFFNESYKGNFSRADMGRLKRQVYEKASEISDITQDKYNEIVDEVANKYAQAKGISQNELHDLIADLQWHWRRIKSSWQNNRYSQDSNQ